MNILVDTSAWIDHFRQSDPVIAMAIKSDSLCTHDFVLGELALGSIADRAVTLTDIASFKRLEVTAPDKFLTFIESHNLSSKGIGFVDVHLLCSASRTPGTKLWTKDKRLAAQAERLGLSYQTS